MGKELDEMLSELEKASAGGGQDPANAGDPTPGADINNPTPGVQTPAVDPAGSPDGKDTGGGGAPDPNLGSPGQEQEINIDYINRAFDGQYASIEEVKTRLEQYNELAPLKAREQEHIALIEQANDPQSFFANETFFKQNEIKKQNPELSSFVINQLLDSDVKEMDGIQALVLKHVMDTPSHQNRLSDVKELINEKYGLDINLNEIEDADDRKIAERNLGLKKLNLEADAEKAKKEFSKILDVKLPEKTDIQTLIESRKLEREEGVNKLKTSFQPIVEGMAKNFNSVELKYPDGDIAIDFGISDQERGLLTQGMSDAVVNMGLNPGSIDDVKKLGNYARNYVIANNLSKILKAHEENIVAKMKDGEYKRHHVVNPGDPGAAPTPGAQTETNADIVTREYKRRD